MGEFIFNYSKINKCIYVFHNSSLFFYSNKAECENNNDYPYISKCHKNDQLTNDVNYHSFLNSKYEYNPNDKNIYIYKKIDNYTFHLVNLQTNINFTDLVISEKCRQKLIKNYDINLNYNNLLIFKVDIIKNITRQIEYQLYNPEPQKIYEKINLSLCLEAVNDDDNKNKNSTRRRLDGSGAQNGIELEMNETILSLPIDWNKQQLEYIDELYNKKGIFFFNSTEEFYNDVCNKYETSAKTDMYLQDRREKIYPTDNLCEKNCVLIDFNNDTNKIICKCPIKTSIDDYDNEDSFLSRNIDDVFDEKYLLPNIRVLKCFKIAFKVVHKNFLFYLTFCLLIGFIVAYFLGDGYKPFSDDPFDTLNETIEAIMEVHNNSNSSSNDINSNNDNNTNNNINNNINNDEYNNNGDLTNKLLILNNNKQNNTELISNTESHDSSMSEKGQIKDKDKESNSTKVYVRNEQYEKDSSISQVLEVKTKNNETQNNEKVLYNSKGIEEEDKEYDIDNNNGVNTIKIYNREQNPANPPKFGKEGETSDNENNSEKEQSKKIKIGSSKKIIYEPNDIQSSKEKTKKDKDGQESNNALNDSNEINDFSLDLMDFDTLENGKIDKRYFFGLFLSLIKYNNTLCLVVNKNIYNNIFTLVALLFLSFSLYLFVNIIIMTDDSSLHLYTGKDLYEKPEPKKLAINLLLIPLIVYAITQIFRKKLSVNEFYLK